MSETTRVLWLSRHEMTAEQLADLNERFGDVEVESVNLTWQATADWRADDIRNKAEWAVLQSKAKVIAGVFPPVALEALKKGVRKGGTILMSPVSRQAPELRVGDGAIPFVHVRWAEL